VDALIREAFYSGTGNKLNGRLAVASNPEFLKEGSAISDTLYADRIVIGSDNQDALGVLRELYKPIIEQDFSAPDFFPRPPGLTRVHLLCTDLASAELIKYAANAFLSTKISFINEIADLAEKVGADTMHIAAGIGLDSRIGAQFLNAGIGWGGSCFGKDTAALVATAREYRLNMPIIEATRMVNYRLRLKVIDKITEELKILKGKTVGLLGLSFKPNTDDLRDAPALDIARKLVERGAKVIAHDPKAIKKAKELLPDLDIKYVETADEVFADSDLVALVTEWPEYKDLPWQYLKDQMRNPRLFDGRNYLDRELLVEYGYRYMGVGR
jgi:UDPglucose 6-dehydrogenase